MHIRNVDLNLLTVFDAVMTEKNATRAAARIGLTQPAVSHALGRLRNLFGDELFVRTPRGLVATPFAHRMAGVVREMLEGVEGLLRESRDFHPAESDRCFALGMSDYAVAAILPRLLAKLAVAAPNLRITVHNAGSATGFALLDTETVELIAGNFPDAPGHFGGSLLYRESFLCAGRKGHPALKRGMTLKRYLGLRHLQVSTTGNPHGYVDEVLGKMGLERAVRVTTGHFLSVPPLLLDTDLVATEPRGLFKAVPGETGLTLMRPPFALPDFPVGMVWHARSENDPGHQWLRKTIRSLWPAAPRASDHMPQERNASRYFPT